MVNTRPSHWPSTLLITVMCLVGVCALPAAVFLLLIGSAFIEEWQETQPGGRGHHPPAETR
jgi:hypothetical protein